MLAIPVLIIVTLFLGWLLVKLTLNALAFGAGMIAASAAHRAGASVEAAIGIGVICAIATCVVGRNAISLVQTWSARLLIGLAFALPAGAAAWSAAQGISGLFAADLIWRTAGSAATAIVIGIAAWRKVIGAPGRAEP